MNTNKLAAKEIVELYSQLEEIIEETFEGEQKSNIQKCIKHFENRIIEAPASARLNYHCCYAGGWLEHTLRVIRTAIDLADYFNNQLGTKHTHSRESIVLAALFHDFGKLGDLSGPYYLPNESDWHREKLGQMYIHNDALITMSVTDRSLIIMNHFGIKVTPEEWKSVQLSDGLFSEGNLRWYKNAGNSLNILYYITHISDWCSTISEKSHYLLDQEEIGGNIKKAISKKPSFTDDSLDGFKKVFQELNSKND